MLEWMTLALCALTLVLVLWLLWRRRDEQALHDLAAGLQKSAQAETERQEREMRD